MSVDFPVSLQRTKTLSKSPEFHHSDVVPVQFVHLRIAEYTRYWENPVITTRGILLMASWLS